MRTKVKVAINDSGLTNRLGEIESEEDIMDLKGAINVIDNHQDFHHEVKDGRVTQQYNLVSPGEEVG